MTKNADGTYSVVIPFTASDSNYSIKVCQFDGDNVTEYGYNGGSYNVDFKVTADCDVTVNYNPETKEIKVTGDAVADPVYVINSIYAVGQGQGGFLNDSFWGVGDSSNQMNQVTDGVYTITYEDCDPNTEYQFKFAANGNWDMSWGTAATDKTPAADVPAVYNGANIYFTTNTQAESVNITLTLDLRNWNPITKEGATYTITVTDVAD